MDHKGYVMQAAVKALGFCLSFFFIVFFSPAGLAEEKVGVIATVNDYPITNVDVDQRLRLMELLGENPDGAGENRREALKLLIDENVIISEAKKVKANPSSREIDDQMKRMAEGMKTTVEGLKEKLKKQDISLKLLEQYVAAQISFGRYISSKPDVSVKVTKQDVEKKYQEIKQDLDRRVNEAMRDPRMRPIEVMTIMEIEFPVENPNDNMLMQARAIEAVHFLEKFKGCGNAKAAASGIFNVKIAKPIEAAADKLPPELRSALKKAGIGRGVGPIRGPRSMQVIAFCSQRTITPPRPQVELPTMEQVEHLLRNEQLSAVEDGYMGELRKKAYIDYKDPSLAPK